VFIFGNLITTLAYVLNMALDVYFWIILVRAVLSWIRPDPYNPVVKIIYRLVDPVAYKISRYIPTRIGMVDISPFILMIIIVFLQRFVVKSLYDIGIRMG
jgi:YggT family protein